MFFFLTYIKYMIFRVKLTFVVVVQLCIICAICKHVSNNCSHKRSHKIKSNLRLSLPCVY